MSSPLFPLGFQQPLDKIVNVIFDLADSKIDLVRQLGDFHQIGSGDNPPTSPPAIPQ
jgi:hypothetical protein